MKPPPCKYPENKNLTSNKFFSNLGITAWTNVPYLFKNLYKNKIVNKEYKVVSRVFFSFLVFLYD